MFEKVTSANIVQKEDATALVYAPEDLTEDPNVRNSLQILASVGRVVNLFDTDKALEEFKAAAQLIK
jgi:hypothetical protein